MTEQLVAEMEERPTGRSEWQMSERVARQTTANIAYYAQRLDEIDRRLDELQREWDIERSIEVGAGVWGLVGLTFGLFARRWNIVSFVASIFLLQHALRGWAPPVSVLRRMGLRRAREIARERYALKALRGDFADIGPSSPESPISKAQKAMKAVASI